jgi:thioredoxin reductase (NADPH)
MSTLNRRSSDKILLVGAGVAGVSAALWLDDLGAPFDWIEASDQIGGTLAQVHNPIAQHPGATFPHGAALKRALHIQTQTRGLEPRFQTRLLRLDAGPVHTPVQAFLSDGAAPPTIRPYAAAILATGTTRKHLGVPGELENLGRGVARSGRAEGGRFIGKHVAIVGGGDAAFENALLLADLARAVTLLHRSNRFQARPDFVERVRLHPRITLLEDATLQAVHAEQGAPFLDGVTVHHKGQSQRLDVQGLLVRIGVHGNLPEISSAGHPLALQADRYLLLDSLGRTSHPRILGAGDCACPDFRAVPLAAGQGAHAAHAAARLLR